MDAWQARVEYRLALPVIFGGFEWMNERLAGILDRLPPP